MKVIYCEIGDNTYMVGFNTSVRAYLEEHQEGNINMEDFEDDKHVNTLYHKGQRKHVDYWGVDIKPKKMFLKVS